MEDRRLYQHRDRLPVLGIDEIDGRRLLDAVVLAYEVAGRLWRATSARLAVHPHGTYGPLAAALALPGCGYHLEGAGSSLPGDVQSIAIAGAKGHPTKLVQSGAMASIAPLVPSRTQSANFTPFSE